MHREHPAFKLNYNLNQVDIPRNERFVLRKKPSGQLLSKTAHQIEREYTILHALHTHNINPSTPPTKRVPVPEPIILCEDSGVIGTPFYIMEFLDGRIFTDVRMSDGVGMSERDKREWWDDFFFHNYIDPELSSS